MQNAEYTGEWLTLAVQYADEIAKEAVYEQDTAWWTKQQVDKDFRTIALPDKGGELFAGTLANILFLAGVANATQSQEYHGLIRKACNEVYQELSQSARYSPFEGRIGAAYVFYRAAKLIHDGELTTLALKLTQGCERINQRQRSSVYKPILDILLDLYGDNSGEDTKKRIGFFVRLIFVSMEKENYAETLETYFYLNAVRDLLFPRLQTLLHQELDNALRQHQGSNAAGPFPYVPQSLLLYVLRDYAVRARYMFDAPYQDALRQHVIRVVKGAMPAHGKACYGLLLLFLWNERFALESFSFARPKPDTFAFEPVFGLRQFASGLVKRRYGRTAVMLQSLYRPAWQKFINEPFTDVNAVKADLERIVIARAKDGGLQRRFFLDKTLAQHSQVAGSRLFWTHKKEIELGNNMRLLKRYRTLYSDQLLVARCPHVYVYEQTSADAEEQPTALALYWKPGEPAHTLITPFQQLLLSHMEGDKQVPVTTLIASLIEEFDCKTSNDENKVRLASLRVIRRFCKRGLLLLSSQ